MAEKYSSIRAGRENKQLTYTQLKKYVMTTKNISNEEYQKLYDRTRNRVRNYERLTGEKIGNVTEFLYKVTRDEAHDRDTGIVRQFKIVQQATSASTGSNIERFKETFDKRIDEIVKSDFAELIEADPVSKQLAQNLKGNELLQALRERAREIAEYKKTHRRTDDDSPVKDVAFAYSEV